MTRSTSEAPAPAHASTESKTPAKPRAGQRTAQAVLEKLFEIYPHLFGTRFLPLKLGIFQELLAAHPQQFARETLKAALGVHTRSTRYLQCVAAGLERHDLQGVAVQDVAPEHVGHALLELFKRRQARSKEDLRPGFCVQLMAAFEASGLTRHDYLLRVRTQDPQANSLLEQAFAERDHKLARQDALLSAYASSGKTAHEFADMYGLDERDVLKLLERKPTALAAA